MNELIQPYLETILLTLLSLVSTVVIATLVMLRDKILSWIQSKTNKEQRELLQKISEEAFSFAETAYFSGDGPQKLDVAYAYVSSRLKTLGVDFSSDEIKATIEKAVLDYNTKVETQ